MRLLRRLVERLQGLARVAEAAGKPELAAQLREEARRLEGRAS